VEVLRLLWCHVERLPYPVAFLYIPIGWKIFIELSYRGDSPPKSNPRLSRRGGSNVIGRRRGLWSTEAKVWGIMPKAAWHWGGDSSVAKDSFGAPRSTPSYEGRPESKYRLAIMKNKQN
jgi:hypothetical protein